MNCAYAASCVESSKRGTEGLNFVPPQHLKTFLSGPEAAENSTRQESVCHEMHTVAVYVLLFLSNPIPAEYHEIVRSLVEMNSPCRKLFFHLIVDLIRLFGRIYPNHFSFLFVVIDRRHALVLKCLEALPETIFVVVCSA